MASLKLLPALLYAIAGWTAQGGQDGDGSCRDRMGTMMTGEGGRIRSNVRPLPCPKTGLQDTHFRSSHKIEVGFMMIFLEVVVVT